MIKKGDIISITFRNGYDKNGEPQWITLERAEVLGMGNGYLQVTYRDVDPCHDDVEIERIVFNIRMSDELMRQCSPD